MSNPIRLMSSFFTVGVWTLISRIAGFARDILIASFFGAGPIAEAFQVAFSLPNMFRRFFAEGAFNMAFVPMFSKKVEAGEDAVDFAAQAFSALAGILIVLTVIAQIFMPWLVWAMASGFVGDARFDLAVDYARICFPYILFISLAALISGMLNATGRFAAAAAAPVLLNILIVGALTLFYFMGWNLETALIWSLPLGGIAQLALVWVAVRKAGMNIIPRLPKFSPELKQLAIIAAPAALAGGVVQINLLVGRQVASYFDGAIQWLALADRLYQLPLGVVGIAIGVVLLPDLSRKLRAGDHTGGKHAFNRAAEFSATLTIPAAFALSIASFPLISVLFQRGAFTTADAQSAALALSIYALGLPAFVFQKVLQPLYFAREDTKTPFYYALNAMILNAVIAIGASYYIGYIAAAWGTTLAAWIMVFQLWRGTRSMGDAARFDAAFKRKLPRIIAASVIMGLAVYALQWALTDALVTSGIRYLALLALVTGGMAVYTAALFGLRVYSLSEIKAIVKRR